MRRIRRTRKRTQRGGAFGLRHACLIPRGIAQPAVIKNAENRSAANAELLAFLRTIPPKDLFILKVGSNDSANVVSGIHANKPEYGATNSAGGRGKDGYHYYEVTSPGQDAESSIVIIKKRVPRPGDNTSSDIEIPFGTLMSLTRKLNRELNSIKSSEETNGYLLSISPIPEYADFEYPFFKYVDAPDGKEHNPFKNFYATFGNRIKEAKYKRDFFPLSAAPQHRELLDFFVNRPEPMVIFNAIASQCYSSLKYIIDMRHRAGRLTYYMGLCDVFGENVPCAIGVPIYPDREARCS